MPLGARTMRDNKNKLRRFVPAIAGVVFVGVIATVAVVFVRDMLNNTTPPKKSVQQITLLQPPPPPPPKVEQPPEQKVEEVKLDEPEPEPVPDDSNEPAPGEDLAVDADGGAGGDGFGLLGKKGGRSLIGSGGSAFGWFATQVQSDVQDMLNNREDIRKKRYAVKVNLWLEPDGSVRNVEMIGSSGNAELDRSLRVALKQITQLKTRPPEDLPQPIRLRIASRM